MTPGSAIAVAFNAAGVLLIAGFGVIYFTRKEFMSYHAVAVGARWLDLDARIRVLLLAFMRATGGLCFAVVFLELVLLYFGLQHGLPWALRAASIGGLLVTCALVAGMTLVSRHTEARPPWRLAAVGSVLFLGGLCASVLM